MSLFSKFLYRFRKYPQLRFVLVILFLAGGIALSLFLSTTAKKLPEMTDVSPPAANPEEVIVITGRNFGRARNDSYVEIGGNRMTASRYVQWNDSQITVLLPQNIQDGLIYVVTPNGRSEPKIFANKANIPVLIPPDSQTSVPVITGIREKNGILGSVITIEGHNFGTLRDNSQVLFPSPTDGNKDEVISVSDHENNYEFWSNQEIRVRIPDGVSSGMLYVKTPKGQSNTWQLNIANMPGTKEFSDRRIYLLSASTDITDMQAQPDAIITLRFPKPAVTAAQRSVEVTASSEEPLFADYLNTIVHQITPPQGKNAQHVKRSISHTFVVTSYEVHTSVQQRQVKEYSPQTLARYAQYLHEDQIVPAADEAVVSLMRTIVGQEKNPYRKASLIYRWLTDNCVVLSELRPDTSAPADLIRTQEGDAYDFAMLFCALARAAGIPAVPDAGILIDANMQNKNHWWCEFYIENFGWIPADPALGAGLEYTAFQEKPDRKTYYFGNLDAQHVLFSKGWNHLKPMLNTGKTVYRPKTYALQSSWEESSPEVENYSSYWSNIYVMGIY